MVSTFLIRVTALIATRILGARQGRFRDEDGEKFNEPKVIPGSSMALQVRFYFQVRSMATSFKDLNHITHIHNSTPHYSFI